MNTKNNRRSGLIVFKDASISTLVFAYAQKKKKRIKQIFQNRRSPYHLQCPFKISPLAFIMHSWLR